MVVRFPDLSVWGPDPVVEQPQLRVRVAQLDGPTRTDALPPYADTVGQGADGQPQAPDDFSRRFSGDLQAVERSPRAAMRFFIMKGMPHMAAAALVGNMVHESDLDPNKSHDKGTGIGLSGWRLSRREGPTGLQNFAAGFGRPENDYEAQLAFAWHELNNDPFYKKVYDKILQAKTIEEAARSAQDFFRPAKEFAHTKMRIDNATYLFSINPWEPDPVPLPKPRPPDPVVEIPMPRPRPPGRRGALSDPDVDIEDNG